MMYGPDGKLTHDNCVYNEPDPDTCAGATEERRPRKGEEFGFIHCDAHWALAMEEDDAAFENPYASDNPPAWFDPADAGEHWGEDY